MNEYPYPIFSEDGKVNCQLCGKPFLVIAPKHLSTHGVTYSEYKLRFPDVPLSCEEFYTRSSYGKEKQIFVKETLDSFEDEIEVEKDPIVEGEINIEMLADDIKESSKDICVTLKNKTLEHLKSFFTNIKKDFVIQIFSPNNLLVFETISDFSDPVLKINIEFPKCFWHNQSVYTQMNRDNILKENGWKVIRINSNSPTFEQIKNSIKSS